MTIFQWIATRILELTIFQRIALTGLAGLLVWELVVFMRGRTAKRISLLRSLVWIAAAVTIADPNLVNRLAVSIGIGRGADVILYLFVLAFLVSSFYFYSRYVRLQRQMTQLVRHLAIREAARVGNGEGEARSPEREG